MIGLPNSPTIVFAGGGTGGHLYPGISVAQALLKLNPNVKPLFLCTTRDMDQTILAPTGLEFIPQPIIPLARSVSGLLRFSKSWRETKDLVRKIRRERKPAAILGLGGYAAGVAVKNCANHKIPAAILNQDVIPGKANYYLLKHVQTVCCQFDQTRNYVPTSSIKKLKTTGCPVRDDILNPPPRDQAATRLGLDPRLSTLVVTGASQGAQTVNDAILAVLSQIKLQGWQILHLAGKDHADSVRAAYRDLNVPAAVKDFTPAMSDVWAIADLAISRSGASSCAELTARGIPSILFPYPFHKDMHQRANAKVLANANAAILLDDAKDKKPNADQLRPVLESLLYDAPKRQSMAQAARNLAKPDAAITVAKVLLDMLN